jgi:Nif-specific regulatory protein
LKISQAIGRARRLKELQEQLLELIFEVIPAEGGAIILDRARFPQADSIVWRDRESDSSSPPRVSRTVIDRVMREGVALSSNDIGETLSTRGVRSLLDSRIHSLLCVPLPLHERPLGVIYLDSKTPTTQFHERHLQLLTAIAGIAAVAFDNVSHLEMLENETRRLRNEINQEHGLVGESAPMQAIHQVLQKVGPADSTALILGENGTGKELAARALHNLSSRAGKPFIAINCAGLSETLIDSDPFGHEKGAFTGAAAQKKGKLELANGGTVFLDELGELPPQLQAKLLRVLQTREFERVGGIKPIKVDIRILAATNRNLEEMIRNGQFREDLFYRLNVVSLTMPALRDRRDDIPLLAHYFAVKHGQKCKRPIKGISLAARTLLANYDWPGNVRELENAIERAIVFGSTEILQPEDLPESLHEVSLPVNAPLGKYHSATKEAKKQLILQTLEQTDGSYTQAAKLLGIHPNNLHRLIRNLGLKPLIKGGLPNTLTE